ncbi:MULTISPECIES: LacI family DNA-binding transcriptional regulator [Sporosarcina]|uniref:LacI family DNA-binding transcriptional regulator n=1 Tax=Sporosarcina TaxID=1569 RepID=UPI00129B3B46|nr:MULTISPECIES: LacI family DNA-binding transcriptional regulator [Sporosarcina]GKV66570.1 LacI family transcriptional regulator [Sporosarcina sp. NCCP-2331]GLB56847.1 LacI family transcriptional regulator [Sporosarcina sp. NCCP-2378]
MKVTMLEVAKQANVSKSTVSQYINKRYEYMSPDTRKRIEQAIEELDYVPNSIAKSLKQKKTKTIGVIVANILHEFSTEIIRSVGNECDKNEYHIFVCNADDDPKKERGYIDNLLARQVDGLIIIPTDGNGTYYSDLYKRKVPIVFLDRKTTTTSYPTIVLDNEETARLAVERIVHEGKKKVAVVGTSLDKYISPRIERIEGYKKALKHYGLKSEPSWVIAEERLKIQMELIKLWDSPGQKPDSFFAINDIALIELLYFVKKLKADVQEQLTIVAVDNSPFLDILQSKISIIHQPTRLMGVSAVELLMQMINTDSIEIEQPLKKFTPTISS